MASSPEKLSSPFILYYGTYSMYSTIVRTLLALRPQARADNRPEMTIKPQVVDISPSVVEQLSETYLTTINPLGLVPALANDAVFPNKPLVESTNISWYIAEWYPQLLPAEHESIIRELIGEMHRLNVGLLTMGTNAKAPKGLLSKTRELLGQKGISEEYRELLLKKEKQLEARVDNSTSENLAEAITSTTQFLEKLQALREKNGTGNAADAFIFGPQPTVLDAHVLVFICRLDDVHRTELIPPALLEWVQQFRKSAAWKEVMKVVPGGTTFPSYA